MVAGGSYEVQFALVDVLDGATVGLPLVYLGLDGLELGLTDGQDGLDYEPVYYLVALGGSEGSSVVEQVLALYYLTDGLVEVDYERTISEVEFVEQGTLGIGVGDYIEH